ncbi:hypothetical protein V2W45_1463751 [Cenococcum geophilum]
MRQFHDWTSWQRYISNCISEYVESLDSKDSIPYPHLLCTVVLYSESNLWNHLGDIYSTYKLDQEEGDDERAEMSGKLEDKDCKVPGDPLDHLFMNISAVEFDPCLADSVKMAAVSSGSLLRRSTPIGSAWDNHEDCYSTDTSLSSLSDDVPEATTPLEATTVDLLSDSEPWNFNAITDAIFSPVDILMDLVDPELRDALPSSILSLLTIADLVEDAHRSIPITTPGHIERSVIQPPCNS